MGDAIGKSIPGRKPKRMVYKQSVFRSSPTQNHDLGETLEFGDGRKYVYCKAGEAIAAGALVKAPAATTTLTGVTQTGGGAAAGLTTFDVIVGSLSAAIAANQLKGGTFHIVSGGGVGVTYDIVGNAAASASGTSITITIDRPLATTFADTAVTTIVENPCYGVAKDKDHVTLKNIGIPRVAITSGHYFWAQYEGRAAGLGGGTISAGLTIVSDSGTAGEFKAQSAATEMPLGYTLETSADGTISAIQLNIKI